MFLTSDVQVTIEPDGVYRLTAPLVYKGRDETFTVPEGFRTDLASVPRAFTWLVPVGGVYDRAAILHDWLCVVLEKRAGVRSAGVHAMLEYGWVELEATGWTPPGPQFTARDTDGIFRRVCRESGTPLVRRWLLWAGVRWGALFTPARRPGWLRDAPAVLAISAAALPLLLLPALFVGLALLVDRAVEAVR